MATYFGELNEIFKELDHFSKVAMECENYIKTFQKSTERQIAYLFLGGLDDVFDQVHEEVLRKDPPLGLQASYAYVHCEPNTKEAMKIEVNKTKPATMATRAQGHPHQCDRARLEYQSGQTRTGQTSKDCPSSKCPYCGMIGHSKSRCFELIGYPEN